MKRLLILLFELITGVMLQAQSATGIWRASVPYVEENGKIIVRASLNHVEGRFILDTGAPCCVTDSFARRAGLSAVMGTIPIQDSNGQTDSLQVLDLPSLGFSGSPEFTRLQTVKWKKGNIVENFGIDGIIGYNFLRQGIFKLDGERHLALFTNSLSGLGCDSLKGIPLVSGTYLTLIPVTAGKAILPNVMFDSGAGSFLDLSVKDYQMLASENPSCVNLLATGHGILSLGAAGLEKKSVKYRVRLPLFNIGGQTFKNVVTITTSAPDTRMGSQLLKYGNVVIDYPHNLFYFQPRQHTVPDLYTKEWDVVLTVMDNHLCAGLIWDTSRLPLKGGERITKVNGKTYGSLNLYEAMTRNLVDMPGDKATITFINEKGKEQTIVIRRK